MNRLVLFATPALFVIAMSGAYFASEAGNEPMALICLAVAIGSLIGWHAAVGHFELSAWRAGRGGRTL